MRYLSTLVVAFLAFGAQAQNVTFQVDMSEYNEAYAYGTVYVNSSFNSWCGDCNPLTDQGNGIWSATLPLTAGTIEYKFTLDGWDYQEELAGIAGIGACTSTLGGFTNRTLTFDADVVLPAVCWESCAACGEVVELPTYELTFNVNMQNEDVSPDGLFLAGGLAFGEGWNVPAQELLDADGDDIYSVTLLVDSGFSSDYTFVNGIGWGNKENIAGQDCAVAPYNDRRLDPMSGPETVSTCFAVCSTDGSCPVGAGCTDGDAANYDASATTDDGSCQYNVTFAVDMSNYAASGGVFTTPEINGSFNGWCGGCNPLSDPEGDNIWTTTLPLPVGTHEYQFAVDSWADQEFGLDPNAACTLGANRFVEVIDMPVDQGQVCWELCTPCTAGAGCTDSDATNFDSAATSDDGSCTYEVIFTVDMNQYGVAGVDYTTPEVNGSFNGWCGGCAPMADPESDGIWTTTIVLGAGTWEYQFAIDSWTDQEFGLDPAAPCTLGANRFVEVIDAPVDQGQVCWESCEACSTVEPEQRSITFRVNMSEVTTNPIGVFIAGNFLDPAWNPGATAMTDDDGDDIWEYTAMLAEGETLEYKFVNGPNWGSDEAIPVACAVNNNRGYTVGAEDAVLDAVCFGSCTACGEALPTEEVTFTVLTDNITVAADGMYLAGAMNSWTPEAMMDNEDGSWSITKSLEAATYEFKFQNGSGGWEELDCGGNRSVEVALGAPVSYQGCFAQCADVCAIDPDPADVTFQVDASQIAVSADGMFLMGSFTEPAWQLGAIAMNDDDGDNIWTATVNIDGPAAFQYKFNNGLTVTIDSLPDFSGEENADFIAGGCGVNNGVGGSNRLHERSGVAETLDVVCFNSCEACVAAPSVLVATVDLCGAAADTVRLTGPFWGWDPVGGPMATDNGDGTWSVTFDPAPTDNMEYLWIVDGIQENLIQAMVDGGACAPVTDYANYANRLWEVGAENPSDVYNSCGVCDGSGGGATTFNVDMSCIDAAGATVNGATSFTEVFVTGPWCGWCAAGEDGYNVLTDPDGDGIYSVEVGGLDGVVEYKYGIDGFTDQENLIDDMNNGGACAPVTDYAGYANRQVNAGDAANDVFGRCGSCDDEVVEPVNVTFRVDMNQYDESYVYSGVFINSSFNGWCGTCNPMSDEDADGVWEVTLSVMPDTIEYKFTLDGWNYQEELAGIEGIEACTSLIDGYTNRSLIVDQDAVLDVVCWESCSECTPAVLGCTDPAFLEYDPYATADDGSCSNVLVPGCMYQNATNYDPLANDDDNSCQFEDGGNNDCPADLDGDGAVTTTDLLSFLAEFGASCS